MANDFYTPSGYPAPNAPGASASMRDELGLIEAGFEKLPQLAGNGNKLVSVNEAGTALVANDDISQVDFDQAGGSDAVARLVWNETDGTLHLGLKGGNSVLQIGQETVLRAYNNTGSAMTDGQVVYINASSGQRPTIALAQANAEATSTKVLGVITEPINNNAEGFVTTDGLVRGLNTLTLTEGAVVWLSPTTAGGLTTTRPTAPQHSVMIGYCVKSHGTQGVIYVKVQNGYELDELHDVLISGLASNNMLRYNGTVWQNIAGPAGAVVGTTDTQTLTNKTISGGTVTGAVVTGLAAPTASSDAATKAYVDSVTEGLDVKASVRVATTANITLSGTQTIDGVAVVAGDRVLVKNQTATAENGIYVVAAGAWSRSSDANAWVELVSAFTFVEVGTTQAGNGYICTVAAGGTLGVTAVTFSQFSSAGQLQPGAGLTRTGNTLDVVTASSSRIVVNADNIDLATTGVSAGTYRSLTVDAYGRATGGTNPTTIAGYGITDAYTKTYIDTLYGDTASAAASAAAAAASYDAFDDRWLGAKASDPTLDNDGNALQTGAVYFSTTLQEMRVWTGLAWQSATTLPNGVFQNSFTATAGQTSYTWSGGSYNPAMLYIYINGVLLSSTEYTATDGANISFSAGLTLGDEVRLLTFKAAGTFSAADITFAPTGGVAATTVQAAIAEVDAETVKLTGDQTIAGTKTFSTTIGGSINGNAVTASTLQTARTINGVSFNGSSNITLTANTPNSVTFNNSGTGAASGTTFNGSAAQTISYNTIGAPSTTGTNASGTWGISISGNAATATTATTATTANAIVDGAVSTSAKMANGIITTLKFEANAKAPFAGTADTATTATTATTANAIADGAVSTSAKIANGVVTTAKISDANVTPAKLSQPLTVSTAVASTSGTAIEFTGIPSWVRRITVMLSGVSTNGISVTLIQIGSGSFDATGYLSSTTATATASATVNYTNGFAADFGSGNTVAALRHGAITLTNVAGNTWIATGSFGRSNAAYTCVLGGSKNLSGTLDRLRITTVNGTDTFDAGTVNIMYE